MRPPFPDLVPSALRREWARSGDYPDLDLYSLFRRRAAAHPERDAIIDDRGPISYARLDSLVRRTASGLLGLGVAPGDVVAVQLPNGVAAAVCDLAIAAVGAIALPFPVGRGRSEVRSLLERSGAALLFAAAEHHGRSPAGVAASLRGQLPGLGRVVAVGAGARAPFAQPDSPDPGPSLPRVDPDAVARILVSSGSETEPKMVAYSHNALAGGRGNFMAGLRRGGQPLKNLFLVPLGSAFGSNGTPVTLARHGGTLVLSARFDAGKALESIVQHRPTHVLGVPTMVRMMLDLHRRGPALPPLTALVVGGAPLDAATARRARAVFGCPVVNLYGSADGVNCHTGLDGDPVDDSGPGVLAGRPDPRVAAIRIVDADLRGVPAGTVGEIIARGPMTPSCYVGAPGLDARYRMAGGWVRTGDLGVLDPLGRLRVVGRIKDVVIRGGVNISPAEVEARVRDYPGVRDACCFGVTDPLMGERLAAALAVDTDLCPTVAELGDHLARAGVEPYKRPEHVLAVDRLPLTPAGKPDRDALRALLGGAAPG